MELLIAVSGPEPTATQAPPATFLAWGTGRRASLASAKGGGRAQRGRLSNPLLQLCVGACVCVDRRTRDRQVWVERKLEAMF